MRRTRTTLRGARLGGRRRDDDDDDEDEDDEDDDDEDDDDDDDEEEEEEGALGGVAEEARAADRIRETEPDVHARPKKKGSGIHGGRSRTRAWPLSVVRSPIAHGLARAVGAPRGVAASPR